MAAILQTFSNLISSMKIDTIPFWSVSRLVTNRWQCVTRPQLILNPKLFHAMKVTGVCDIARLLTTRTDIFKKCALCQMLPCFCAFVPTRDRPCHLVHTILVLLISCYWFSPILVWCAPCRTPNFALMFILYSILVNYILPSVHNITVYYVTEYFVCFDIVYTYCYGDVFSWWADTIWVRVKPWQ